MKKLLILILIFLAIFGVFYGLYYLIIHWNNCHLPINYSVGKIDSRFEISESEVITVAQGAAGIWNNQTGENLLIYDENSSLKIEMIYDYRQEDLDKLNHRIEDLTETKQSLEDTVKGYQSLLAEYVQDLTRYNNEVSYWNSQGGAPTEDFQRLQDEKIALDERRKSLIEMAQLLNIQAETYNSNLENLNDQIKQRKNLIITQGFYLPAKEKIEIYTYAKPDELQLVLAHELGHALGLGHGQNPQSIMHKMLGDQDLENLKLSQEDINLLERACNLREPRYNFDNILRFFRLQAS